MSLNGEDDSFIILGTSPGSSLDVQFSGTENGDGVDNGTENRGVDKDQLDEALKDLPVEANMAFKAHFKLGASDPSTTSMMVASNIITDDKSTEEIQKSFGELLDENVILKETLKQNNESMKEHFLLLASCQEDMMKTQMLHREKFDETKELVKRLREENRKLKHDISRFSISEMSQSQSSSVNGEKESVPSSASSALEFVTSPDDDTINKLTAQLELVEKERRQIMVENDKLTWQKDSLEHIVDVTTQERDDYKEKMMNLEVKVVKQCADHETQITGMQQYIRQLQFENEQLSKSGISPSQLETRDNMIKQLEKQVADQITELQVSQVRVFELESVRMELSKQKAGENEIVQSYKEIISDLQRELKETSKTLFEKIHMPPKREPLPSSSTSSEEDLSRFHENVEEYEKTLNDLSQVLDSLSFGGTDRYVDILGLMATLNSIDLNDMTVSYFKSSLCDIKCQMSIHNHNNVAKITNVKNSVSIFRRILQDFTELLAIASKQKDERMADNVGALTGALLARALELQDAREEVERLKDEIVNTDVLRAQMELFRSDFEAERESREKIASEKENVLTDLRTARRQNQELVRQLDEVRKINSSVYHRALSSAASPAPRPAATPPRYPGPKPPIAPNPADSSTIYTCPKCMRFSCQQYKVMEDHFDFCLDDLL